MSTPNPQNVPADALSLPENFSMQTVNTLFWEMMRNISEFPDPVDIDKAALDEWESAELLPGMRDVMLARVGTLGHKDKFPKQYDWENILPTLQPGEELLWIVSKRAGKPSFELYVGLKFNRMELTDLRQLQVREARFQVFCDHFSKRLFPESVLTKIEVTASGHDVVQTVTVRKQLEKLHAPGGKNLNSIFCVLGMPSVRDMDTEKVIAERKEDVRPFSSLNDILEPHINIDSPFSVIFSVSPATSDDIRNSFGRKFALRDQIKPFMERDLNRSHTVTIGSGKSVTLGHVVKNKSTTTQEKSNIFYSFWRGIVGTKKSKNKFGEGKDSDKSKTKSTTKSPDVKGASSHEDTSDSSSETVHVSRSDLIFLDKNLERSLAHLQQAIGAGGYYATATVYADRPDVGESIARSIRAALSGVHSYLRPMQIFELACNETGKNFFQLNYNIPMADILADLGFECEVLNRDSACLALPLPDTDLPDKIKLKKSVFYARPEEKKDEHFISLGDISYFENQLKARTAEESGRDFRMAEEDIFSHMFVVGTPGSGKSARTTHILRNLPSDIRLIVLETAKREYAGHLRRPGKDLIRYTLGNSQINPLRINPFYFDPGTGLKQHIAVLADAIADLLPMEALIGPKLREAVERCYRRCGWDIETSSLLEPSQKPIYPDMLMFNSEVRNICNTLTDYGPEVRSNYTGALKNRASIFLDDVYQDIFSFDGNKPIDELFPPDADVVVEMEDMPPSEINMPAFIISVILQRLRAYRFLKKETEDGPKDRFIIAIEEAHNVLSRKIEGGKHDEMQSGKGEHLLNQVVRLLAEGRGLGLGIIVIDQSAHAIAPSVLADTNTKVILRLEDGDEIKTIGTSIGLNEKDWPDLQRLGTGECIVKSKRSPVPVKLARLPEPEAESGGSERAPRASFSPPYIRCEKMLDDVFRHGLFSQTGARKISECFVDMCETLRPELMRYIWGKYLFTKQQNHEFDKHIDWHPKTVSRDVCVKYYACAFLKQMQDCEADNFIGFMTDDRPFHASAKSLLTNGFRKILRIMKEDCPDNSRLIDQLRNEMEQKFASLETDGGLEARKCFLKGLEAGGLLDEEWPILTEHTQSRQIAGGSDADIDAILGKYKEGC